MTYEENEKRRIIRGNAMRLAYALYCRSENKQIIARLAAMDMIDYMPQQLQVDMRDLWFFVSKMYDFDKSMDDDD